MTLDIRFYIALLLRRLPVMLMLLITCIAVAAGVAFSLPPRYVASAQLLLQSAQIQGSTVTVASTERLQIIQQQLLTRANLLDMARKFDVFAGEGRMTPDEIVEEMRVRSNVWINQGGRGRNAGATFFNLNFTDDRADTAADVVNEYVTLVLALDAKWSKESAGEQLEFFEAEVDRLGDELAKKSAEIVSYEDANKDALPGGSAFRLQRQTQLQQNIDTSTRNRATLVEQRNTLVTMARIGSSSGPAMSPQMARLQQAEADLADARSRFSETNPKVRLLKDQVEKLQAAVQASLEIIEDAGDTDDTNAQPTDPNAIALQQQIRAIDQQIEFLDQDVARAKKELESINASIERSPLVAIRLAELNRDYTNIQTQYDRALAERNTAEAGERIELTAKGERLRVIENATAPDQPNSPDRKKILATGFLAGGGLAGLFFIAAEVLNRAIRRPADLVGGLGVQPFSTIPFLETARSRRRRRAIWAVVLILLGVGIPAALWSIHEFYYPLDYIFDRIVDRLS